MSKRVVIVEDDAVTARYLELGLKRLGYRDLRVAVSSDAALELVRAAVPDLVLMDIQIEGARDGIETARALRAQFGVPVIFLTSHADEVTVARAKQVEPLGYLVKPVKAEELRTVIAIALHQDRVQREARLRGRVFAAIAEAASDAVLALDAQRRIAYMNPAAETLLGQTASMLCGKPWSEALISRPALDPAAIAADGATVTACLLLQGAEISVDVRSLQLDAGTAEEMHVLLLQPTDRGADRALELRRLRAELAVATTTDELTGHLNRRGFLLIGEQQLRLAQRTGARLSLLSLQVLNLQSICAELGARAREQALQDVAGELRSVCESGDLIGRVAEDRFVVLTVDGDSTRLVTALPLAIAAQRTLAGRACQLEVTVQCSPCDLQPGSSLLAHLQGTVPLVPQAEPAARGVAAVKRRSRRS